VFVDRATLFLHHIMDWCDTVSGLDYEETAESLTVPIRPGTTYLFNVRSGLGQLWMSSPVSGGHHFEWCDTLHKQGHSYPWVDTRNGQLITDVFFQEVTHLVSRDATPS